MAELTTLARPYAKAVFRLAQDDGSLDAWSRALALLVALIGDAKVARSLAQPSMTAAAQAQLLVELAAGSIDEQQGRMLHELARYKRLALLPHVAELFEIYKAEREHKLDVEVVSAFELDAASRQSLATALQRQLGREVHIHTQQDAGLIGGVIVHAGDLVIDASLRGRIAKLRDSLNS